MIFDYTTKLVKKEILANSVYLFELEPITPKELIFKAGQYLLLKVQDRYRQFSIASPESEKDTFRLVVQIYEKGLASEYLQTAQIGSEIFFKGPAGVFNLSENSQDIIFLATGTGIAPILSMIVTDLEKGGDRKLSLYWGLRRQEDIYFKEVLDSLVAKHSRFSYYYCLSQEMAVNGSEFRVGRVTTAFEKDLASRELVNNFQYYVCGSPESVEGIKLYLEALQVKPEQVFSEKFAVHGL